MKTHFYHVPAVDEDLPVIVVPWLAAVGGAYRGKLYLVYSLLMLRLEKSTTSASYDWGSFHDVRYRILSRPRTS